MLRALWAVVKRELIIFIRYPTWVVAIFIWPVLFPLPYIFGGKALAGPNQVGMVTFSRLTGMSDYVGFVAIGSLLWMWMNMVLWSFGNHLRNEQVRGTLESNWLSPLPRIFLLAGAGISNCLIQSAVIFISLLEFYLFLGVKIQGNPLLILLVLLFIIPSIYGIGLLFASLVIWAKEVNTMVFLVRGIMMIFCGVSFPLTVMPEWMQVVSKWIPITYGIRAFRLAYLTKKGFEAIKGDLLILGIFGLIFFILGILAFALSERFVKRKGTLGVY
ncbi:hypothetical protein BBF96_15435 [Anoxybacter fermentans]|uniref:ABC transmembrane type-2 domain-containing protein n=2 Tax=Anoxybacter fermentans TaxID=1323375 RepID=A0A3Q9HSU4_9FIRM|nr:hypothetical protein BBF96_15435 [Anoxybacter fermentans]